MENKYRKHVIIEDIEKYPIMVAYLQVKKFESKAVYHMFDRINYDDYNPGTCYLPIPKQVDKVGSFLPSVDPLLNDQSFYQRISNHADLGK